MQTPVHRAARADAPLWRRLLDAFVALAMLGLTGAGVLILTGISNRWADIVSQFAAPLALAALAGLALSLLAGFRRARWMGLAASGLLLAAAWPQWSPAGPKPEPGAPTIRLYSANVHYLNTDAAAIRRSIQAARPDVVVLIEMGQTVIEQRDAILEGYPHRAASMSMEQTRGPSRTVIASRWPLSAWHDPPDGLHAVAATVRTPLGPVTVVGAHLTRPWPFQNSWGQISQTQALADLLRGSADPVIVAGDFNSVSSARIGRQVKREIGLHPAPGFPGTWPSDLPAWAGLTIDQVYASPMLAFRSRRIGLDNGSDHRPVVTEITRAGR